jgi:hypothetical protein
MVQLVNPVLNVAVAAVKDVQCGMAREYICHLCLRSLKIYDIFSFFSPYTE